MNKFFTKISTLLPLTAGVILLAQDTNEFGMSLQIRPRTEYRNGAYRPLQTGEEPAILTHNRTRLTMDYANGNRLKVKLSLQNVNVWGQTNQIQPLNSTNNFAIFEGYADLQLSETMRTKIGRQMIAFDDDRIFGTFDWNPSGRSHDALNVSWKQKNTELQTYLAFNQNYAVGNNLNVNNPVGQYFSPTNAQPYQHLEMIYAKHHFSPQNYLSVLVNNLGFKDTTTDSKMYNMQTIGANYFGNNSRWNLGLSAYYQFGKTNTGLRTSSTLLSASAGYKINNPIKIGLGIDYLSGDDTNKTSDKTNVFNPLYGTHHKFYGIMDYFYTGNSHGNVGLLDTYLKFSAVVSPKFSVNLDGHFFNSGAKVYENNQKKSGYLGSEWDFTFNYKIMKDVSLSGGYSTFFDTKTLQYLKKTPNARANQDWLWISLNINPQIFKTKF